MVTREQALRLRGLPHDVERGVEPGPDPKRSGTLPDQDFEPLHHGRAPLPGRVGELGLARAVDEIDDDLTLAEASGASRSVTRSGARALPLGALEAHRGRVDDQVEVARRQPAVDLERRRAQGFRERRGALGSPVPHLGLLLAHESTHHRACRRRRRARAREARTASSAASRDNPGASVLSAAIAPAWKLSVFADLISPAGSDAGVRQRQRCVLVRDGDVRAHEALVASAWTRSGNSSGATSIAS